MQHKLKKPLQLHAPITDVNIDGGHFTFGSTQTIPDPENEGHTKEIRKAGVVQVHLGQPHGRPLEIKLTQAEEDTLEGIVKRGLDKLG